MSTPMLALHEGIPIDCWVWEEAILSCTEHMLCCCCSLPSHLGYCSIDMLMLDREQGFCRHGPLQVAAPNIISEPCNPRRLEMLKHNSHQVLTPSLPWAWVTQQVLLPTNPQEERKLLLSWKIRDHYSMDRFGCTEQRNPFYQHHMPYWRKEEGE